MPVFERLMRCVVVTLLVGLAACAASEPDTRYLLSKQRPPLQIPAGMDSPHYNAQMMIPDVKAPATGAQAGVELERPPQLEDVE